MTDKKDAASRRSLLVGAVATFALGTIAGGAGALYWAADSQQFSSFLKTRRRTKHAELVNRILPAPGIRTGVSFGDAISRLAAAGVISPTKFERLYARKGGLPVWAKDLFENPSDAPIVISKKTAPFLLNLLWPLGLSNLTAFNLESPIKKQGPHRFASTAGWTLGEADNGAAYFNKMKIIRLNEAQEQNALEVANNIFRPCCNNSTFFQDCNHGSALLGLLELAAAQGMEPKEMYRLALAANAYWYPNHYIGMATYFEEIENLPWQDISPRVALSRKFSSYSGWQSNVHVPLNRGGFLPNAGAGGSVRCAV